MSRSQQITLTRQLIPHQILQPPILHDPARQGILIIMFCPFSVVMDEQLVIAVQQYPCLWDVGKEEYRNQRLKTNAWAEVSSIVGMQVEDCQLRFKSLRDKYRRELKKETCRSGSAGKIVPKWSLLTTLDFLRPFTTTKNTSSNLELESDTITLTLEPSQIDEQEAETSSNSLSVAGTSNKKRKRKSDESGLGEILKALKEKEPDDDDELFLLSLRDEVKSLPPPLKWKFKVGVMAVITELKYQ